MSDPRYRLPLAASMVASILVLTSEPAHALRCGNRVIQEGMHETQVLRLCGEPVSWRTIGRVSRAVSAGVRPPESVTGYAGGRVWVHEEVEISEMIYNFGPRKLMRRLRFEAAVLVSIRTMGYGYVRRSD